MPQRKAAGAAKRPDWYFVCECGAKFFCSVEWVECPRCNQSLRSHERLEPPWRRDFEESEEEPPSRES